VENKTVEMLLADNQKKKIRPTATDLTQLELGSGDRLY